jgi:hypothetical protein
VEGERLPTTEGGTEACVDVKEEREEEKERETTRGGRREIASNRG